MSFVCFIQAAEIGVVDLSMPVSLWALNESGRLRANDGVLITLPTEMSANVLKRDLLRLICDCTVNPVSAILLFARARKISCVAPDCVG